MGRVYLLHFEDGSECLSWIARIQTYRKLAEARADSKKGSWFLFTKNLRLVYENRWVQRFFAAMIFANFMVSIAETSLDPQEVCFRKQVEISVLGYTFKRARAETLRRVS